MPQVIRQDIDNTSSQITVKISRTELQSKIDAELKRFRNRAAIKGFRPGQAPMAYVKKLYGGSIVVETFNEILQKELFGYLKESGLQTFGQPLISEQQQPFSLKLDHLQEEYEMMYDIGYAPDFEIQGLDKGQEYERLVISDAAELAEKDIEDMRRRAGKRINPEEDIQLEDILQINARELENEGGGVLEGGLETTITVFVHSVKDDALKNTFLSGKKGDTIRFNARLVDNFPEEKMYRKYVLNLEDADERTVGDFFEGVINEVTRVEKAEMDTEFLSSNFGEGVTDETSAQQAVAQSVSRYYEVRGNALLMREFQRRLMDLNQMELPDAFLKRWIAQSNENALSQETIEAEYPGFASNLRWNLIKEKLVKMFDVEVTEAAIRAYFTDRVRSYFRASLPDDFYKSFVDRMMKNEKEVDEAMQNLELDQIFEAVRKQVTINDKPIPSGEFQQIFDAANKSASSEA